MIPQSRFSANDFSLRLTPITSTVETPPPTPTPAPGEPLTLGEQFITVALSLHYGEREATPAAEQWERARREVMGGAW